MISFARNASCASTQSRSAQRAKEIGEKPQRALSHTAARRECGKYSHFEVQQIGQTNISAKVTLCFDELLAPRRSHSGNRLYMCRWISKASGRKKAAVSTFCHFFVFFSWFLIIHWAVCGPRRIAFTRSASWPSHLSFSAVSQNRSLFAFLWNLLPVEEIPPTRFAIQPRLGKNGSSLLHRP